ncbi:hypothetical protein K0M31_002036, partial [Melipona bicolor]
MEEGEAEKALEITETFRRLSEVSRDSERDRREGGRPQQRAGSEQVTGSSAPSSAVPRHGHSRSSPRFTEHSYSLGCTQPSKSYLPFGLWVNDYVCGMNKSRVPGYAYRNMPNGSLWKFLTCGTCNEEFALASFVPYGQSKIPM